MTSQESAPAKSKRQKVEKPPEPQAQEVTTEEIGRLSEVAAAPETSGEAVAVATRPETCVFCGLESQVDPANLEGAKFITEPALSIRHFVCAGCGDA